MRTGSQLIEDERKRQMSDEGWTAEHDAKHEGGELSAAAVSYAEAAGSQIRGNCVKPDCGSNWPWTDSWWKPSPDPVRNLVKSGALIAAEIDRLIPMLGALELVELGHDHRPLPPQEVERGEDMGAGRLCLFQQPDGDIIVAVYGDNGFGIVKREAIEFCSVGAGGGASPRTMEALRELMRAMDEDNRSPQKFGGRAEHGDRRPELNMDHGLGLAKLRRANVARQDEWCPDQKPDLSFRGNELAGEVGEACNVIKKLERERHGWRGTTSTTDDLAGELADVIITADLVANACGIDLGEAVEAKFNWTSAKNGLVTRLRK